MTQPPHPTVKYPCAHHGDMQRFSSGLYVPPTPPRPRTLAVNRSRGPQFTLDWQLNRAANRRMVDSPYPHTKVTAIWTCPVCSTAVPRLRRPGRHRVYCTNACRQRAYRLRCKSRQHHPISAHIRPLPARAATRDRVHAIREYADVSSGRRDSIGRGITACGAFARMSIDTPSRFGHLRFAPVDGLPNSSTCRSCMQLTGVVPRPTGHGGPSWFRRTLRSSEPWAA